ncbi:hypothetical protein PF005_g32579, partial [Phytophthora fragariae]
MVKLLLTYALVGLTEGGGVEIDDGLPVWKLKDAIKEKENSKDRVIRDLHLFLAKTTDGKWLDGVGVAGVTVDEAGTVPVMVDEHGNCHDFVKKDPLLCIKNDQHFGENFQPSDGQVHVLVVVPEV